MVVQEIFVCVYVCVCACEEHLSGDVAALYEYLYH